MSPIVPPPGVMSDLRTEIVVVLRKLADGVRGHQVHELIDQLDPELAPELDPDVSRETSADGAPAAPDPAAPAVRVKSS